MTAPSPASRQERFHRLSAEIDDLVARYPTLPPGRTQSICQAEIDKRLRAIEDLNAEQDAEEEEPESRVRMPNFPGIGISLVVILVGVVMSVYLLILAGAIGILASLGSSSRSLKSKPQQRAGPPERFEWRP